MDELFNTQNENPTDEIKEDVAEQTVFDEPESVPEENLQPSEPVYNPVVYSPVEKVNDYKPMSTGLKVFSLILALILVLTGTTLTGYFVGKNSVSFGKSNNTVKVDLESVPDGEKEMTAAKVYEGLNKSVVGISVYNNSGEGGQASGIVYSKDGYIITNDHIYNEIPNPKFKIYTFDGKEYTAKYIAGDTISDLAVLKIADNKLEPAVFGNSDELYMGQKVVAIGRPNDATDNSSITSGIISALNRRVQNSSNYSARLIQTDSPINPGSSGGALVNMYGQVVGITSSKLARVDYEGVGYAIPTTIMKRIVEELIKEGKVVSRAKLGITYTAIDSVTAEINNYKNTGLLIQTVSEDSDLYGKISKGDIITEINGTKITADDMVLDIIESCSAGDTISVTVVSESGKTATHKVTLKANIGESSFTTKSSNQEDNNSSNSETFDFPFGE